MLARAKKHEPFTVAATLEILPNVRFRRAYGFWNDHRRGRDLPLANVIGPHTLPKDLLPNISVVAVETGPKRFFIRLVGTAVVRAIGKDLTGKWGEDVEGGAPVLQRYARAVEERRPIYHEGPLLWPQLDFKLQQTVMLPFVDADGRVNRVLAYAEYQ